ncbi:MAG: type II methionyl aminopeptidase [Candidatus Micrarchaeota archaeon]|nr:type II methionyl aminopeptidase [Candidatus Micrarchaeota archaeon]
METDERIKKTIEAGKVAKEIRKTIKIKEGDSILELCKNLEMKMKEMGCEYAFPVNVSVNEITAHDTASVDDERVFTEKDLVKIDIGVHKDGFIADGSATFDLSGEHGKLMDANIRALENAISVIKDGVFTSEIGKEIETTLKKYGFKPIDNLTGHALGRYIIHSNPIIPNFETKKSVQLKEGDIVAIEPFATYGNAAGHVSEMDRCEIFSADSIEPTRNRDARRLIEKIFSERKTLPFAERHYASSRAEKIALIELVRNGSLIAYPVLREVSKSAVSQFEHTVIVGKDSAETVF